MKKKSSKLDREISENSIRPYDLYNEEKEAAIQWDRDFLLKRKKNFINVDCPACFSNEKSFYFDKLSFNYDICMKCNTVFVNPRPNLEILHEFYSKSKNYEYWNKYIFPASDDARRENIFKPRAEKLISYAEKILNNFETILEIGAGFGTMSTELVNSGKFKRVIASELTPDLAATCREKGLETIELPVENIQLDTQVDVIASFEVIEHLFSVKLFLESCHKLLNKKGLLVLSCPNFEGFDFQILGKIYGNIDHEHLNYFNPDSLKHLIEKFDFRVLEITTPGQLDADIVRNQVIKGNISLEGRPFLKKVLIERWPELGTSFQEFLSNHLMSGHMWAVAQKI